MVYSLNSALSLWNKFGFETNKSDQHGFKGSITMKDISTKEQPYTKDDIDQIINTIK